MLREPGRSGWCATGLFRALLLLGLSGLVIQSSPAQSTHEENVVSGVVRPASGSAHTVELLAYPPSPGSVEAPWPVGQLPAYRARESVPPEGGSFDLSVGILQLVRVRALLGDRPLAELAAVPLAGWRELPMLRLSRVGDLNLVSIPEAIADSPTPVVLHLQGERPSDLCRVAWRPAERTERIRPDSGRMVLPAFPEVSSIGV